MMLAYAVGYVNRITQSTCMSLMHGIGILLVPFIGAIVGPLWHGLPVVMVVSVTLILFTLSLETIKISMFLQENKDEANRTNEEIERKELSQTLGGVIISKTPCVIKEVSTKHSTVKSIMIHTIAMRGRQYHNVPV